MSTNPEPLEQSETNPLDTRPVETLKSDPLVAWLFWRTVFVGMGLLPILFFFPVDIWITDLFYSADATFYFKANGFEQFYKKAFKKVTLVLAIGYLLFLGWKVLSSRVSERQRVIEWLYTFAVLVVGPGLVTNVLFKENWGRARPRQIVEFGGSAEFSYPFQIVTECASNCSFVTGDASIGFALVAFALIAPINRRRWIKWTVVLGAFLGLCRIVVGAHFFSDVIYCGVFNILVALLLYREIVQGYWRSDGAAIWNTLKRWGSRPSLPTLPMRWRTPAVKRILVRLRRPIKYWQRRHNRH